MLHHILQSEHARIWLLDFCSLFRFAGNEFVREANYPPWNFPTDSMPKEQNSPAAANFSAFENHPSQINGAHEKKKLGAVGIVLIIGGIILVAGSAALTIVHRQRSFVRKRRSTVGREDSMKSLPTDTLRGKKIF